MATHWAWKPSTRLVVHVGGIGGMPSLWDLDHLLGLQRMRSKLHSRRRLRLLGHLLALLHQRILGHRVFLPEPCRQWLFRRAPAVLGPKEEEVTHLLQFLLLAEQGTPLLLLTLGRLSRGKQTLQMTTTMAKNMTLTRKEWERQGTSRRMLPILSPIWTTAGLMKQVRLGLEHTNHRQSL